MISLLKSADRLKNQCYAVTPNSQVPHTSIRNSRVFPTPSGELCPHACTILPTKSFSFSDAFVYSAHNLMCQSPSIGIQLFYFNPTKSSAHGGKLQRSNNTCVHVCRNWFCFPKVFTTSNQAHFILVHRSRRSMRRSSM